MDDHSDTDADTVGLLDGRMVSLRRLDDQDTDAVLRCTSSCPTMTATYSFSRCARQGFFLSPRTICRFPVNTTPTAVIGGFRLCRRTSALCSVGARQKTCARRTYLRPCRLARVGDSRRVEEKQEA